MIFEFDFLSGFTAPCKIKLNIPAIGKMKSC